MQDQSQSSLMPKTFFEEHFAVPAIQRLGDLLEKKMTIDGLLDFDPFRCDIQVDTNSQNDSFMITAKQDGSFVASHSNNSNVICFQNDSLENILHDIHIIHPLTLESVKIDDVNLKSHQKHCWHQLVGAAIMKVVPNVHHAYLDHKQHGVLWILHTTSDCPQIPGYLLDIFSQPSPFLIQKTRFQYIYAFGLE